MIPPDSRQLFHDLLAPPPGYALDCAVGTTFSLDLESLLMVPLAFLRQAGRLEENETPDPVALLASLRRHADRLTVFCQAGQVALPAQYPRLAALLEPCVQEVLAPQRDGVFHPKVWALRFAPADETSEEPWKYRVLVMSRNLTADRSWDLAVALEGEYRADRQRPFALNHPLAAFFRALPSLACRPLPVERRRQVEQMAEELRFVEFAPPEGLDSDDVLFWPTGFTASERPADPLAGRADRMLVIAPFVEEKRLRALHGKCRDVTLVSRLETLDALSAEVLGPCAALYTLNRQASTDEDDAGDLLQGLHAKCYVMDQGWHARLLIGSHNATSAAFARNVECSVAFRAMKSTHGVEAMLRRSRAAESKLRSAAFADLLDDYLLENRVEQPAPDEAWDRLCLELKRRLAEADFAWRVAGTAEGNFEAMLMAERAWSWPEDCTLHVWPVSVDAAWQQRVEPENATKFPRLSFEALTGWTAFKLTRGGHSSTWVMNLPLHGAPENRTQRLLAGWLDSPGALLRLLLFLLGHEDEALGGGAFTPSRAGSAAAAAEWETPLLETLLRTAVQQPAALVRIRDLLRDLAGSALVPPQLEKIWQPIWEAAGEDAHG